MSSTPVKMVLRTCLKNRSVKYAAIFICLFR
jgi:hypothetical protein